MKYYSEVIESGDKSWHDISQEEFMEIRKPKQRSKKDIEEMEAWWTSDNRTRTSSKPL